MQHGLANEMHAARIEERWRKLAATDTTRNASEDAQVGRRVETLWRLSLRRATFGMRRFDGILLHMMRRALRHAQPRQPHEGARCG